MHTIVCDAAATGVERAVVVYFKGDARLAYCGHHDAQHGAAMVASGWEPEDAEAVALVNPVSA